MMMDRGNVFTTGRKFLMQQKQGSALNDAGQSAQRLHCPSLRDADHQLRSMVFARRHADRADGVCRSDIATCRRE
jgi:hypothetical protein